MKTFNHKTNDYGVWVPFDGLVYSDWYSIRTDTGEEYAVATPSGDKWFIPVFKGNPNDKPHQLDLGCAKEIALLQRTEDNEAIFQRWKNDILRRRSHVVENSKQLHPEEDLESIAAKKVQAAKMVVKVSTTGLEFPPAAFEKHIQLNRLPFTRRPDGIWELSDIVFDLDLVTGDQHFEPLATLKQLGAQLRLKLKASAVVSELDYFAIGPADIVKVEWLRNARRNQDKAEALLAKVLSVSKFSVQVSFYRTY